MSGNFSYGTTTFTLKTNGSALIFTADPQCCDGTGQDPNSFVVTGTGDTAALTLWGFTGVQGTGNSVISHTLAAD